MKKIDTSIIIVNYKSKNELFNCINSIKKSKSKYSHEIIVVDNDEKELIKKELLSKFKNVKYIKAKKNLGFGAGNNLGAKSATGEYLFFLNPDTLIFKDTIKNLIDFIKKEKNAAGVSPIMLHKDGKEFFYQGTKKLGLLEGIFSLSFIDKLFPKNFISKSFYYLNWNRKNKKEVGVLPGSSMLIKKDVFEKVKGFDENFFLYFEENDLCNRIRKLGYKFFITPSAKIIHLWEKSTSQRSDKNEIFNKSRYLYFKKHYGLITALIINFWLSLKKTDLLLLIIIVIGIFLRFYKLEELMIFIGDQGWFYLSARDLLVNGNIPLVGIPSSVVWLKQGPLATYFIAFALYIGKFNPVAPAILFSLLDVITIFFIYLIGKRFINLSTGLFSAAFYATSPLIALMARMPYHTSPIPFFACLFFLCFLLVNEKSKIIYFLIFLILGFLIQLELSNFVLFIILAIFIFIKKLKISKGIIFNSIIGFIVGIFPFVIYDFTNKFVQTLGLPLWVLNRIRLFFGLTSSGNSTTANLSNALLTTRQQFSGIIFPYIEIFALFIIVFSLIGLFLLLRKKSSKNLLIILLWLIIPLIGFLVHASPGGAYYPLVFPAVSLVIGIGFSYYLNLNRYLTIISFIIIIFVNLGLLVMNNYYISTEKIKRTMPPFNYSYGPTWTVYDDVATRIVNDSNKAPFQVVGKKSLGVYSSGVDNFKYIILFRKGNYSETVNNKYYIYYNNEVSLVKNGMPLYRNNYFSVFKDEEK